MNIFGYAFRGIFGSISPGSSTLLPNREQLQYMQDVYSLANTLRVTPDVAATIIAGRKLAVPRGKEGGKA